MLFRPQRKTIVIGCQEICGWISLLSDEFRRSGYRVISISPETKYYKDQKYTISKEHFASDYFFLRTGAHFPAMLITAFYNIFRGLFLLLTKKDLYNRLYIHANNYLYKSTDIYIHIWEGLEPNDEDLFKFKSNGAKIVSWFVGDDIRYYPVAVKEFDIKNSHFLEYNKRSIYAPLRKLRMHEKHSDVIFSVPDQSSLALRPYFHLQIPLNLLKYTFINTGNHIPLVVHIPSAPLLKGSPLFELVVKELQEEGLRFNFKSLTNIPNDQVRKMLSEADILLDELYMHGPGMLGMEAMASGCCVVVKFLESSPSCFRPPVVSVTPDTLKNKLRELIVNKKLREELIVKGRSYVESNNKVSDVCGLILNKLNSNEFDYYPTYFRERFNAESEDELKVINNLTSFVMDCEWYKKFVKPGVRSELVF